jgi:hypothetical protein
MQLRGKVRRKTVYTSPYAGYHTLESARERELYYIYEDTIKRQKRRRFHGIMLMQADYCELGA